MRHSKKRIELHYLTRFKELLPSFPDGEIVPTEEPDFLVRSAEMTLGIELTELHRKAPPGGIPQQASEAMRLRVMNRAQELYVSAGYPPCRCFVLMHDRHIGKDEVEALADSISKIAIRNLPPANSSSREEYDWTNRAYFPEVLISVRVNRMDAITRTHFTCPSSTWVAALSLVDIQHVVDVKDGKYANYRRQCDEAWLLISVDTASISTWFEYDSAAINAPVKTNFNRVFVLRHFGGKVHEIAVEARHEA